MRFWFCLLVAACGADSASTSIPAPPTTPRPTAPRPPPPPRSAPHGSEIIALAATLDGQAAATADRLGGLRLWTTLDGAHEPVVIQGTAAKSIALWRDGDGFAIATLDAAGGVQVLRTTATGVVSGRATVTGGPVTVMASTPEGLLILRTDQVLELVDAGGVTLSRLLPDPGTRIAALVSRAGRVLALVEEDKRVHGRWVAIQRGARWGDATPNLPFAIARAVLSPGGDLLAVSRPRSLHPALIDLAKGTALKVPLCVAREWPQDSGEESRETAELLRGDNAPLPLGFLTDKLVACAVMTQLTWWGTDGTQQPMTTGSFPVAQLPITMTDRGLIAGLGPNLAIATPETSQFLGHGVHELTGLRITPGAVVVTGSDQQAVLLDEGLRERARFELGRGRTSWTEFVPLDERYGVVSVQRRSYDRRTSSFQLAVFDGLALAIHQLLPFEVREGAIAYEPSTRLLATRDGAMAMLLRYDPRRHTFGEPVRVGSAIAAGKLVVLDPRLSRGVVALEISDVPDGLMIGELRDEDLAAGTAESIQPRTTYRVPGELRAVDRAGHLYIRPVKDHDDLMIYTRDLPVARLPGIAGLTIRPSPDGTRIAAFHSPRLVLLTAAGEVRWDSAQWSGADVDWTSTGELVVQFPTGVARIDLDTGELADRRCGWSFGLSDQVLDARHSGPSICD